MMDEVEGDPAGDGADACRDGRFNCSSGSGYFLADAVDITERGSINLAIKLWLFPLTYFMWPISYQVIMLIGCLQFASRARKYSLDFLD